MRSVASLPLLALRAVVSESSANSERLGSFWGALESNFHERLIRSSLRGESLHSISKTGEAFGLVELPGFTVPAAMERVAWHRRRGDRCILVSASLDVYLTNWAAREGFETVLATRLNAPGDIVSGEFFGPACWGLQKLAALKSYLGDLQAHELHVYGDSRGDEAILEVADFPYRVSPGFCFDLPEG